MPLQDGQLWKILENLFLFNIMPLIDKKIKDKLTVNFFDFSVVEIFFLIYSKTRYVTNFKISRVYE